MRKFYSVEQFREYYFPVETAKRRDRELRENDPDEWLRQQVQRSVDRVFGGTKL